jgi:hypothetical protein
MLGRCTVSVDEVWSVSTSVMILFRYAHQVAGFSRRNCTRWNGRAQPQSWAFH